MFGKNTVTGRKFFQDDTYQGPARLYVTSIFYTFQGEGPHTGKPALFIRLARCNLTCSFCFVAGTKITMGDGTTKRIEDVVEGDIVLSWDGSGFIPKPVVRTMQSRTNDLVSFRTSNGLTTLTPEHPILVRDKGWVEAKDLDVGDVIIHLSNSERLVVTEVNQFTNPCHGKGSEGKRWTRYSGRSGESVNVYNFEVEDTHTYVANGMVVHNCDAYFEEGDWMTVDEILARARDLILNGAEVGEDTVKDFARLKVGLVLTGGEPMLQDEAMAELFTVARNKFAWHQIETNGTQNIKTIPKFVDVVVSPKCLEKSGKAVRYLEVHQSCLERAACFKFVVSADPESPYHDIPDYAKKTSLPIYVSPMNIYTRLPSKALRFDGTKAGLEERSTTDEVISFWEEGLLDRDANKANHEYAARLAVKRGYNFNLQQHLYGSMA